jgi:hypothetical protein
MQHRTARRPRRTSLTVEQLETRDVPSVAVSVLVPGGHHRHHHRPVGVGVHVHVGPGVAVGVNVGGVNVGVNIPF